jgi:hypothetical protein
MGVHAYLEQLTEAFRFEPKDQYTLTNIEHHLQDAYPGKYKLKWKDIDNSDKITMKFENEHEKTIWLLKSI